MYVEGGVEVLGEGSTPSTETVPIKRLLFPAQLHDGVLEHAAARRLDHMNYQYEPAAMLDLNGEPQGTQFNEASLELVANTLPLKALDGESMLQKVEKFCAAGAGAPSYGSDVTRH